MDSSKFHISPGIYAAVLTPLHLDLSCNLETFTSHCLDLLHRGCEGIALFGTTGEGASFSVEERWEILRELIERGIPAEKIILGNGSSNYVDTLALAQKALVYPIKALLIAPPSFFKDISEEGILAFYRNILQSIDIPHCRVLLYHIPQFSGVPITINIIRTLREEFPSQVIGIKESEGNLPFTKEILQKFPGFQVFVGDESQIAESGSLGGSGSICGMANFCPEILRSLFDQGKKDPHIISQDIQAVSNALRPGICFISAFKALLRKKQGDAWISLRPPLQALSPQEAKEFLALIPIDLQ